MEPLQRLSRARPGGLPARGHKYTTAVPGEAGLEAELPECSEHGRLQPQFCFTLWAVTGCWLQAHGGAAT